MMKLYFLTEVDSGDVSPYDLTFDQRITDEVVRHIAELGASYEVKVTPVAPHPSMEILFSVNKPDPVKGWPDRVGYRHAELTSGNQ
jgi:hypothetical protein